MLLTAAEWLAFDLFGLDPASRFGGAVAFFIYDSVKIIALLAVMIFVVGVLRTFLPLRKMRGWMSSRGIWPNLAAALFGAVTPFCSCSSIPLFIGFLKAGVPLGVSFSFLITSPILNEYLFVLMAAEFGIGIALLYALSGIVIGVLAGSIIGRMRMENQIEPEFDGAGETDDGEAVRTWGARFRFGFAESVSVLRSIWLWVLVGVGVGAVLHNYVPRETIHDLMQATGIFSVPLATILGVPMYGSCAAIVPIAVVLFEKGIPLGTALAFLMAVSALSLPEAVMLRRAMRLPLILLFFAVTAAAIIATGYLLNLVT